MSPEIREDLLALFDEAYASEEYENTWFKDNEPASSILTALDALTVEQALARGCGRNPVAGHAQHLAVSLEGVDRALRGEPWDVDWEGSWQLAEPFGESEWEALRLRLRRAYAASIVAIREREDWSDLALRRGTIGTLAHAAFHLGAIRQIAHSYLPHE